MQVTRGAKIFGTRRRTEVLTLLALLGESYPTELARLLGAPVFSVQNIVDALENEGIVATRPVGQVRRVVLDPRFPAARELADLLQRLGRFDPAIQRAASAKRARPRRKGKPL